MAQAESVLRLCMYTTASVYFLVSARNSNRVTNVTVEKTNAEIAWLKAKAV